MSDTPVDYFSTLYEDDPDPWGFDEHWYERRKYALTVAALPHRRFRRILEPGCANGALTELLAPRCDQLYAFDFEPSAVKRARDRVGHLGHVPVVTATFPDWWPSSGGDLVVLSEVAYYLSNASAERALAGLQEWLEPDGTVISVHYTGATDYPRRGADIGPWLDSASFLCRVTTVVDESFELGVWRRRGQPDPTPGDSS